MNRKNIKIFVIALSMILCMVLCMTFRVYAADFHVTTSQEFQTALSTAAANGVDNTIYLAEGIYGGNFSFVSMEDHALAIKAEEGLNPGQVILDGKATGRVLLISAANYRVDFTLERIILRNGYISNEGGGIYLKTLGDTQITDCSFLANMANKTYSNNRAYGGGIYIAAANSVSIVGCNITQNKAICGHDPYGVLDGLGSGIYAESVKTVVIMNSNILENGQVNNAGAGIYIISAEELTLRNNNISKNWGPGTDKSLFGNTIHCYNILKTVSIIDNSITSNGNNSSPIILISGSNNSIFFNNNIVTGNSVDHSCIYISSYSKQINFTDNRITNNTATRWYSGVRIEPDVSINNLIFHNNELIGNSSGEHYGALYLNATNISFKDNRIEGNSAKYYAGGYLTGTFFAIVNNQIIKNSAQTGYAGLCVSAGNISLINNTISGNVTTTGPAGGIYLSSGSGTLNAYNNIIWGNQAGGLGDDIYISGTGVKKGYNNNYHDLEGLWSFADKNVDLDPLFVDSINGDFHLRAGSLCLNIGDNNAPDLPATDMEGNPRIADGIVDLGAYEHSTTDLHPADVNQDWVITSEEFNNYGAAWKNGNTWQNGPNPIPIDYTTRAGFLLKSGGSYKNAGGGKPGCWAPVP